MHLTDGVASVGVDPSEPRLERRLGVGRVLAVAEVVAVRVPGDVDAGQEDFLTVVVEIGAASRESAGAQRRPTAEQQRNEFEHGDSNNV